MMPTMSWFRGALVALVLATASACSPAPRHYAEETADAAAPAEDTADAEPRYPAGPYGIEIGETMVNLSLEGYRLGAPPWTAMHLSDLYDPNGERGIYAIVLNASAAWCPPCGVFANNLPTLDAKYTPRGTHFIELMVDAVSTDPADQKTVDDWLAKHELHVDTVIEPTHATFNKSLTDFGFPGQFYIDPRTMKIVARTATSDVPTASSRIDNLLAANGAPP
jgi:hypothetical protein